MQVSEVMVRPVQTCGQDASIADVARRMVDEEHGALAITLHDYLVGIISERDVVRAVAEGRDTETTQASEYMTRDPDSMDPDIEVTDAAEWMLAAGYRHLPVAESGKLLGMVSMKDIMWAITGEAGVLSRRSANGQRD
jgi:signal-transduction protein with cAMP-binding, CBS, and nucleotidyltransferase domain